MSDASTRPKCLHCRTRLISRPRKLCHACFYTAGVAEQYPLKDSKFNRRGVKNVAVAPPPDAPTAALPGSPAKVAVMEARAAMGRSIWHPADARYEGDPRPAEWLRKNRKAG